MHVPDNADLLKQVTTCIKIYQGFCNYPILILLHCNDTYRDSTCLFDLRLFHQSVLQNDAVKAIY